jgi:pilus assembly protein Flp/PilA
MAVAFQRGGQFFTSVMLTSAILTSEDEMKAILVRLWKEDEGQDLVEYGLLLVLISLVAVGAMSTLGSGVSDAFSNAAANLAST